MADRSNGPVIERFRCSGAKRSAGRGVVTGTICWAAFATLLLLSTDAGAAEIRSYAIVQDNGTLRVQGKTIRLFGIYMPSTERGCRSDFRPPLCGSRAVRTLEILIQGFVRCQPQVRHGDRSISAICYVEAGSVRDPPVDLGARLIELGLAVARPEAPFEYHTLERIAKVNRRGVWGFQVDQIIR